MARLARMTPALVVAMLLIPLGTTAVAAAQPARSPIGSMTGGVVGRSDGRPAGNSPGLAAATHTPWTSGRTSRRGDLATPRRRIPTTPRYTGRVIVRYSDPRLTAQASGRRQQALAAAGRRAGRTLRSARQLAGGATLVSGATPATAPAVAAQLAAQPGVASAEPDIRLYPMTGPDPALPDQWNLAESRLGIRAATAWTRGTGSGVRVAVLDSGITDHPDLARQTVGGYDFIADSAYSNDGDGRDADPSDPGDWAAAGGCPPDSDEADAPPYPGNDSSWHGSLVTGVIAAVKDNGIGIAGAAPGVRVVPIRVLGKCGGDLSDIADALRWAAGSPVPGVPDNPYPAKIINLSLGAPQSCSAAMQSAVDAARRAGATVVVAAGNDGVDARSYSPAGCAGVISVGATTASGVLAGYSNRGIGMTLVAPGGDYQFHNDRRGILSTANSGLRDPKTEHGYYWTEGTSLAAPHVSAVAALVLQARPTLTPDQVRATLTATARKSCTGCGAGVVDAARAVGLPPAPSPVVTSVSPAAGPLRGGSVVAVSGARLTGTELVTVGGSLARVVRTSPTRVWVVVPARRTPTTAAVVVTTRHGTNPTVAGSLYRYVPAPALTRLSQRSGSRRGGSSVTLSGTNLSGVTAVYFGTQRATRVRTFSSRRLVVRSPRVRSRGVVYVRVQTAGGVTSRVRAARFSYR